MKMNPGGEAGNEGALGADKSSPKDAQVMISILKDMGILEFEPRVINQLLEFSYRYITTILDDAKMVSSHAKKKAVDGYDIKLAVQMYTEENLTTPPGRDVLLETARTRNTMPLPLPKPTCGLRLPPDRYCITNSNYRLEKTTKRKTLSGKTAGSSFSNQNNPNIQKFLVTPGGSNLAQSNIKMSSSPMPKMQLQSGSSMSEGQPMFNMIQSGGVKRKAAEIDNGDQYNQ